MTDCVHGLMRDLVLAHGTLLDLAEAGGAAVLDFYSADADANGRASGKNSYSADVGDRADTALLLARHRNYAVRLRQAKLLSELYNYSLLSTQRLLDTLYFLIGAGRPVGVDQEVERVEQPSASASVEERRLVTGSSVQDVDLLL